MTWTKSTAQPMTTTQAKTNAELAGHAKDCVLLYEMMLNLLYEG